MSPSKGPSKTVNLFMSVQTLDFFRPTSPWSVQTNIMSASKTRVSHSTTFIVQQQKITSLWSLLCHKWYLWLCVIYDLQITANVVYYLCIQRKYVQFQNIKFKMTKSQHLLGLETSFKTDRKLRMLPFISHQKHRSGYTPSPHAYVLYICEHVDNYG